MTTEPFAADPLTPAGCPDCVDHARYLREYRVPAVVCGACGWTVTRKGRRPPRDPSASPRLETDDDRASREAREEEQMLRDMACVARWRAHAAAASFSATLARNIPTKVEADPGEAKRARAASAPTDAEREADIERGRRLDAALRAVVTDAVAARLRDRPLLELLRVLASLVAYDLGTGPMPDPLPADWAHAPVVRRHAAVLEYLVEHAGDGRTHCYNAKGEVRQVATWAELVGAAFTDRRVLARRARGGDAALTNAIHGRPLFRAAAALWAKVRPRRPRHAKVTESPPAQPESSEPT